MSEASDTYWIGQLKSGDRAAVQHLWDRYFDRLVRLARKRLESAAQLKEQSRRLLDRLDDDSLRELALLKLEGFSNEEIAARLQCGLRTVERRLRGIRAIWFEEDAP